MRTGLACARPFIARIPRVVELSGDGDPWFAVEQNALGIGADLAAGGIDLGAEAEIDWLWFVGFWAQIDGQWGREGNASRYDGD